MKRKLMAMTLALMLMLTLTITVSAASVSGGGTYEGYGYETIDTCETNSYSSMTIYDSMDFTIYSTVDLNSLVYDAVNKVYYVDTVATATSSSSYTVSSISGTTKFDLTSIYCVHYIDGDNVYSAKVNPG